MGVIDFVSLMTGTAKLAKLEMVRGAASVYVFAGHAAAALGLGFFFPFGQEAVMSFFLLSGFVIYYSTARLHQHEPGFLPYFIRRSRRILPVYVLALLVTGIFHGGDQLPVPWWELIGNLLMLQDLDLAKPGVWFGPFLGNLPLWSLAYEWWFYLLFYPIYRYVAECYQLAVVTGLSLLGLIGFGVWPNPVCSYLLYFILWWTGLELARTFSRGITPTFSTQRPSLFVLAGMTVLVTLALLVIRPLPTRLAWGLYPLLEIRHFADCLGLASAALLWSRWRWRGFEPLFRVFLPIAPISYALYAFHYTLMTRGYLFDGLPPALNMLAGGALALALAWLADVVLYRVIVQWSTRFLPA